MSNTPIDHYRTIQAPTESLFKEKASKFFAYAFHVANEAAIAQRLEELKKKHYDARHHCYAWILGADGKQSRANDAGEPSNSAGKPILGQIVARDLTYTLVVVVRYFGGTKLGVGGLMQAYKTATAEALDLATVLEKQVSEQIVIRFAYPETNVVMRFLKQENLPVLGQDFEMDCSITTEVRLSEVEKIRQILHNIPNLYVQ